MLIILLIFAAGILSGIVLRGRSTILKGVSRLTDLAVGFMLFVLGVSIGVNETVVANLSSLGFDGLVLAVGAILGSLLAMVPLAASIFRERS
jgi:uncharacterized membrane protein YbjE (DUF340 family)